MPNQRVFQTFAAFILLAGSIAAQDQVQDQAQAQNQIVELPPAELATEGVSESFAALSPLTYDGLPLEESGLHPMLFRDPDNGRSFIPSEGLLPPAADPNDFQFHPMWDTHSLGVAAEPLLPLFRPAGASSDASTPHLRFGLQLRPGIFYDTGYAGGATAFNPVNIALDGSAGAHQRGQISFYQFNNTLSSVPTRLQFDTQTLDMYGAGQGQAYVDAMVVNGNSLVARSLFLRLLSTGDDSFLVGKAETVFGDLGSAPMIISNGALPVGAVGIVDRSSGTNFTGVSQFRYSRYWNRLESTFSLEDQSLVSPTDVKGTALNRWPSFAGRLRYAGVNGFDSIQVAGLVRPMGFNDATFHDHFVTGYGISTIAKFRTASARDAIYLGAVGGRGVGNYMYGGTNAAAIAPASISSLSSVGYYASYQHVWYGEEGGPNLSTNVAYGHVLGQAASATDNHLLQQAWCNLLWNISPTSAFGIEYQYGMREIGNGTSGDDHRILLSFQVAPGSAKKGSWSKIDSSPDVPHTSSRRL